MRNVFDKVISGGVGRFLGLAMAGGVIAFSTAPARGGERDRSHGRYDHDESRVHLDFGFSTRSAPRYEERRVRVWVDPVYRTVCDRVWVAPVVRTECERVWVPACYEWRYVTRRDHCGRRFRIRERVEVAPGHFEERRREVVVRAGRWVTVERRELVCEGHYEWRTESVRVVGGGWRDRTAIGFGFDVRN